MLLVSDECEGHPARDAIPLPLRPRRTKNETRNPPRDFGTVHFVFGAKVCPQGWFFVHQHKKVKQQPDKRAVFKQRHVSKNQALAENGAHYRCVHRISHITIQAGNNQMARWEDRRRRAQAQL